MNTNNFAYSMAKLHESQKYFSHDSCIELKMQGTASSSHLVHL